MKERCPELRSLAGVFDGHKRAEPAEMAAKRLPELLARSGALPPLMRLPERLPVSPAHDGGGIQRNEVRSLAGVFDGHMCAEPAKTAANLPKLLARSGSSRHPK